MKSALSLALVCATLQLIPSQAQVVFQLRQNGSLATTATVAPGGTLTLDVVAVSISAEAGILANLDSFTYRLTFPDQLFTLANNVFTAPFDNTLAPGGFNGSIPWAGLPLPINFNADAGSPGATPLVPDLYRTTATTTGVPVVGPNSVLETLTLTVPLPPGGYHISLNVLEAADNNGALHTTDNGTDFVLTVGNPNPCLTDVIPPVISLHGGDLTIQCHTTFTDPGATATDNCPVPGTVVTVTSSGTVDANTPGTYTITYHATDAAGNPATASRSVHVVDTLAPVITLNGANPLTLECHTTFTDPGATATDLCAGSVSVTSSGAVNVNTPGNYTITYHATDPTGNTGTATRTVHVADTLPPVIILNGANPTTLECHTTFTDPGATALNICAGSVSVTSSGAVNANTPGSYTITYTATDPSGNTAHATRTVHVTDTLAPVITLNGANPFTVECHTAFTDPGASATDACAGSVAVTSSGPVDANVPGSYTITYSAADPSGNTASATRTVHVVDGVTPVITLNGANPLTIPCHTTFTDPGATATDACAGSVSVTVSGSVDVNTSGNYTLTYTATDPTGNSATSTRTVMVGPCQGLNLTCTSDITMPNDTGQCSAVVSYPDPVASGGVGPFTIVCSPPSGSTFPVAATTVHCSVTDGAAHTATCSFRVTVNDTEAPTLTCPAALTVQCVNHVPPALPFTGTVTDTCDPSPVVTHVGDVPSGTHPIHIARTYQATDASGNVQTCTQTITVQGLLGDLNGDCCVDRTDLNLLLDKIRARSTDLTYDLNGDGKVDIADARFLVLHFTNPGGTPCPAH